MGFVYGMQTMYLCVFFLLGRHKKALRLMKTSLGRVVYDQGSGWWITAPDKAFGFVANK
jgi:hypothetical protein